MRVYELMVIHDGDLDDVQVQDALKQVRAWIEEVATIANVDFWGRRRFAYEIKHKTEGYYSVIELLAEGGAMDPVERLLRLADDVVRHKLIRLPDHEAARRGLIGDAVPAASE
ncbi:MAG: small subunit ribosomal protein S6 [Candidatus Poriferisodalaceae bacterium]|jgi:small subunit ribosomal protein S6